MARSAVGRLTIDLGAVRENYRILQNKVHDGCDVAAVVKADAYGLGVKQIAQTTYAAGCRYYFVSNPHEGVTLRKYIAEDADIYILNGYYGKHGALYLEHRLTPVIGSFQEVDGYKNLCKTVGEKLPVVINFNTGMNRLGFGEQSTNKLLNNMHPLKNMDIKMIMSHLASADDPNSDLTEAQYDRFMKIAEHFPQAKKSLANSYGVFADDKYHLDMVRPGMALYGLNPSPQKSRPMQDVAALRLPIIRTRFVNEGETVGYNETYTFTENTTIAVVSAGYADGIFCGLSNTGTLYCKGYPCPIRGRVSMDLITVDLCNVPINKRPRAGQFLELLGNHQSADDLAQAADTIGYEILTSLGERYRRKYIKPHT
jgi:alanine racemase